ncbi:MAG: inorganic phosphate transporter [Desulfobacteraceae bacterium]|nr:inorganic phosphate transporter [Desulfobacteraceae bacterium]
MDIYVFLIIILIGLACFDLIVGVSNDAVNFLNSSIGSKVAPRHIIMIVASLGMLAGVTFSSGMMEVARKGIFHPGLFLMPELMTIFLAVMLTDILLLDLFNTFGLPTSTTVSIVFELLGAAVAVSIIKIYTSGDDFTTLVNYINTGKALAIILGILMSVVIAFFFGAIIQFIIRFVFTFEYREKLKIYGGIWGGITLSTITYFILIKGSKGASFLTPEVVVWIKSHTWTILSGSFVIFTFIFQVLSVYTRINILKPIVLVGTFALAMAFAANDLVNFIGVPLAGLNAYKVALLSGDHLNATMEALQQPIQSNTILLLIAGGIMVVTLWFSGKARTVTKTEVNLGRQDEGIERFESSALSRVVVRMFYAPFDTARNIIPASFRRLVVNRFDQTGFEPYTAYDGSTPSFDLLRASVNLMVASAVVSFATSLKLPLSTTYVTFMVAMGTSLSDQAWGRESAVYRVTGVLTVIGGWFLTAISAFTVAMIFALIIYYLKVPAVIGLIVLLLYVIRRSYKTHFRREKQDKTIEAFSLENVKESEDAINKSFEQTGIFLKETSNLLRICFEAALTSDRIRLKETNVGITKISSWSDVIISNMFNTLYLVYEKDLDKSQKYSTIIRSLKEISESCQDIVNRAYEHVDNFHNEFLDVQKDEIRQIKTSITRLLENISIMMLKRKKVDYDYISNQCNKLERQITEFDRNQIRRIQNSESTTRLSILFYGFLENSLKISRETRSLLEILRESFSRE